MRRSLWLSYIPYFNSWNNLKALYEEFLYSSPILVYLSFSRLSKASIKAVDKNIFISNIPALLLIMLAMMSRWRLARIAHWLPQHGRVHWGMDITIYRTELYRTVDSKNHGRIRIVTGYIHASPYSWLSQKDHNCYANRHGLYMVIEQYGKSHHQKKKPQNILCRFGFIYCNGTNSQRQFMSTRRW